MSAVLSELVSSANSSAATGSSIASVDGLIDSLFILAAQASKTGQSQGKADVCCKRLKSYQMQSHLRIGQIVECCNEYERRVVIQSGTYDKTFILKVIKINTLNTRTYNAVNERDLTCLKKSIWFPKCFLAWFDSVNLYLMSESVYGICLAQIVGSEGRDIFTEKRICQYSAQLVSALNCIHEFGFILCNLNSFNVILDGHGQIRLTNFGALLRLSSNKILDSPTTNVLLEYCSPEFLSFRQGDLKHLTQDTDLWSLGILMYFLFYGVTPFETDGDTKKLVLCSNIHNCQRCLLFGDEFRFPSMELTDLIRSLLKPINTRLKYDQLLNHQFYSDIIWSDTETSKIDVVSPIIPDIKKLVFEDTGKCLDELYPIDDNATVTSTTLSDQISLLGFSYSELDNHFLSRRSGAVDVLLEEKSNECRKLSVCAKSKSAELETMTIDVSLCKQSIESLTAENAKLEAECISLQSENMTLKRQLEKVIDVPKTENVKTLDDLKDMYEQSFSSFEGHIKDLEEATSKLQSCLDDSKKDVNVWRKKAEGYKTEMERVRSNNKQLQFLLTQLKERIEQIRGADTPKAIEQKIRKRRSLGNISRRTSLSTTQILNQIDNVILYSPRQNETIFEESLNRTPISSKSIQPSKAQSNTNKVDNKENELPLVTVVTSTPSTPITFSCTHFINERQTPVNMATPGPVFDLDKIEQIYKELGSLTTIRTFNENKINQLETKLNDAHETSVILTNQNDKLQKTIKSMELKMAENEKLDSRAYMNLMEENSKLKLQKADIRIKLRELERDHTLNVNSLTFDRKDNEKQKEQICNLQQKLNDKEFELSKAKDDVRKAMQIEIDSIKNELVEKENKLKTVNELQNKDVIADEEMQALRCELNEAKSELSQFKRESERRYESTVDKLQNELSLKVNEFDALTLTYNQLKLSSQRQCSDNENGNRDLEMALLELDQQLQDSDQVISQYRNQIKLLKAQISDSAQSGEVLRNEIDNLKEELLKNAASKRNADSEISTLEKELSNLRLTFETQRIELQSQLQEKLSSYQNDTDRKDLLVKAERRQIDHLQNEIDSLKSQNKLICVKLKNEMETRIKLEDGLAKSVDKIDGYKAERNDSNVQMCEMKVELQNLNTIIQTKVAAIEQHQKLIGVLQARLETSKKKKGIAFWKGSDKDIASSTEDNAVFQKPTVPAQKALKTRTNSQTSTDTNNSDVTTSSSTWSLGSEVLTSRSQSLLTDGHEWKTHNQLLPVQCLLCSKVIRPNQTSMNCDACKVVTHAACASNCHQTCQMVIQGGRIDTPSPGPAALGRMNGWVKLNKDDNRWIDTWAVLWDGQLSFYSQESTTSQLIGTVNLREHRWKMGFQNETVPVCQLTDQYYALEVLVNDGALGNRKWLFLAPTSEARDRWYMALQQFVNDCERNNSLSLISQNKTRNIDEFSYSELIRLDEPDCLNIRSTFIRQSKKIIMGCESGLYWLPNPVKHAKPNLLPGIDTIYKMCLIEQAGCIVLISGSKRGLSFAYLPEVDMCIKSSSAGNVPSSPKLTYVNDIINCIDLCVGYWLDEIYVAVSTQSNHSVQLLQYCSKRLIFTKFKTLTLNGLIGCMTLQSGQLYVGTDRFSKMDLITSDVVEFLNENDKDMCQHFAMAIKDKNYPVACKLVSGQNSIREFVLCFQKFCFFLNEQGERTRAGHLVFDKEPTSLEITNEFMVVTHSASVEIFNIPSDDRLPYSMQLIEFSSPRFVGVVNKLNKPDQLLLVCNRVNSVRLLTLELKTAIQQHAVKYSASIRRVKVTNL